MAGVSVPTASRSLRDDPQITLATRVAVRWAADRLGYVPNAAARNLANRSSKTLGLMVPDVTDPVHGQIVSGFEREVTRHGYVMLMSNSRYDADAERRGLSTLIGNQVEGIAIFGGVMDLAAIHAFAEGTRLAFIGPENLEAALKGFGDQNTITVDDASGVAQVVEQTAALGYRRFGYVSGPTIASCVRRRNACVAAVAAFGLERLRVYEFEDIPIDRLCHRIIRDGRDIVLCFDDQRALRLLGALHDAGIKVPEQLGVVGFDDIPFAGISNPSLSTVAVSYEEMGRLACEMLLDQVTSGDTTSPAATIEGRVVLRGTTANRTRKVRTDAPATVKEAAS
jgi:LacI family transcriptional regulator